MKMPVIIIIFFAALVHINALSQPRLQVVIDTVKITNGGLVMHNNGNYLYAGTKLVYRGLSDVSLSSAGGNINIQGNQASFVLPNSGAATLSATDMNFTAGDKVQVNNLSLPGKKLYMGDNLELSGTMVTTSYKTQSFPDADGTIALQEWVNAQGFAASKTLTAGTGISGGVFNGSANVTFTNNVSTGITGGQSINGGTTAGQNITINSTANATKGFINLGAASTYDETNKRFGIKTVTPSHSLTMGIGAGGIALYNTQNQTSDYERFSATWSDNILNLASAFNGSGIVRPIQIGISTVAGSSVPTRYMQFNTTGSLVDFYVGNNADAGTTMNYGSASYIGTSGIQACIGLTPTITQSSSAGFTGVFISPFLNQQGSGTYALVDAGTNTADNNTGTHTSKFSADIAGTAKIVHAVGLSNTPSVSAGTAAGTSPSASISGTDISGEITITTGTSVTTGTLFTVTFATAYGSAPKGHTLSAYNGQASVDISKVYISGTSTTTFVVSAQTALSPSTQYQWSYTIVQ